MAVKAETLETPERDQVLQTREGKPGHKITAEKTETEILRALQQRIKIGLNSEAHVDPRADRAPACRSCYQRGWTAALQYLLQD